MLAARFRALAETATAQIDALTRPRLANTPKRARQAMQARLDAANIERTRAAMLALSAAIDAGTLPAEFAKIRTRADVEMMVSKRSGSTSYYEVHESDEYRSDSHEARAFRAWLESVKSNEQRARETATAKAIERAQLERSIQFADIPGFFPTPAPIVERMIRAADLRPGMKTLEPSAGKGDILEAMTAAGCNAVGFEINHTLADICKAKGLRCECEDFMEVEPWPGLDRVVMNPPFEHQQDAKHIRRAFDWLKPDGGIIALASAPILTGDRYQWFRDWLDDAPLVYTSEMLPEGSFVNAFRSTGVNIVMLTIRRYS